MQTIKMKNNVYLTAGYSMVGPLEGKGPLKEFFDYVIQDTYAFLIILVVLSNRIIYNVNYLLIKVIGEP